MADLITNRLMQDPEIRRVLVSSSEGGDLLLPHSN